MTRWQRRRRRRRRRWWWWWLKRYREKSGRKNRDKDRQIEGREK
jgi:hypothetical protein